MKIVPLTGNKLFQEATLQEKSIFVPSIVENISLSTRSVIVAYCNISIYVRESFKLTGIKLKNTLLLQHGRICITVYGTFLLQKHIKFHSKAVRCK